MTDEFMNKITNGQYQTWSSEQMMKRYQVPFVIWANYDIKEQHIEKTSMNYIQSLSLIHISEPTRRTPISYAVFCLKKKKKKIRKEKKKKKKM